MSQILQPHFVVVANTCAAPFPSGLKGSLQRMQLEYVDVVFANRPDSNTPMEGELSTPQQTLLEALKAKKINIV